MKIRDFLSAADVAVDVRAADKASLLKALAGRAAAAVNLPAETVAAEIEKRDDLGSTGIGRGVAIPHARLREVRKPFALLARLKNPIEFDAVDGEPVDLVFLLILPAASQLDQLNCLAAAARTLRDAEAVRRMRDATSTTELYRAVTEDKGCPR
ncbi:MAG TPA: PTS sugar transporter subunit IIA [Hyphomicrobiaceae bacterium]|jgi:PTS system nitrogen regulatory IIA component